MIIRDLIPPIQVSKMKTNVRRVGYVCVLLFADPTQFTTILGTGIVSLAILFHGWAAGYLAREGNKNIEGVALTLGGPYRHNRNPYYVSHFLLDFGFFVLSGHPLFYLLYFPFIFSVYRFFVLQKEEPFLMNRFGEAYENYKSLVPRWGIRFIPASIEKTRSETFSWRDYWFNREFSRSLNHMILMGVFWLIQLGYLPIAKISIPLRSLLLSLYCTWILIHYFEPNGTGKIHYIWLFIGLLLTGPMLFLLPVHQGLWKQFSLSPSWLLPMLGGVILLFAAGVLVKPVSKTIRTFYRGKFDQPLELIFLIGVGLGLLLSYTGVLWSTIVICLFLWFVNTSEIIRFQTLN